jgi:probable rRNA maturation factor
MSITLDIEIAVDETDIPTEAQFNNWLSVCLTDLNPEVEVSLRVVDNDESQQLNRDFRGLDKPTNVLSFPYEDMPGIDNHFLGDIAICAPVVKSEALQQGKSINAHWAHMLIHGTLHLLGYDHLTEHQAVEMESLEKQILEKLGFNDPYQTIK